MLRKGGKIATMPLAPRVARAVDMAIGERLDGPIFVEADGRRLDRHAAGRSPGHPTGRDHQAGRTSAVPNHDILPGALHSTRLRRRGAQLGLSEAQHVGPAILVTAHSHADTVAVLRETDPGVFELNDDGSPFPMKITISMPEPGRLLHPWWYGPPGDEAKQHDTAELRLQLS